MKRFCKEQNQGERWKVIAAQNRDRWSFMHFLLFLVIDKIQELFLDAVTLKIYLYLAIYLKTTAIVFNNKIFPSNPLLAKVSASPLTTPKRGKTSIC